MEISLGFPILSFKILNEKRCMSCTFDTGTEQRIWFGLAGSWNSARQELASSINHLNVTNSTQLKVLYAEMDPAESRLIRQIFIKGCVAEVF